MQHKVSIKLLLHILGGPISLNLVRTRFSSRSSKEKKRKTLCVCNAFLRESRRSRLICEKSCWSSPIRPPSRIQRAVGSN